MEIKRSGQITIFLVISLLLIVAATLYYLKQSEEIKDKINSDLTYISTLKVGQIDLWLKNKRKDAYSIQYNKWLLDDIYNKKLLADKNNISTWLNQLKDNNDYSGIKIIQENEPTTLNLGIDTLLSQEFKNSIVIASNTREIQFVDIHQFDQEHIRLGFTVPLIRNNSLIGVVALVIDPTIILYPLVQTWLTDSKTAETLINRAEGGHVIFLNNLRHNKNSALKLKFPITRTEIPAVQASRGYRGIYEGYDYRGNKVLSYLIQVPGTRWTMVAKIDYDEVITPLTQMFILVLTILFLSLSSFGFIIAYNRKSTQTKYYKGMYQLESENRKQKDLLQNIIQALPVGIWIHDKTGKVINNNKKALEIWNCSDESNIGNYLETKARWYESDENIQEADWDLWEVLKTGKPSFRKMIKIVGSDKREHIIYNSVVPVIYENEILGAVVVNEDITNLKNAEDLTHRALKDKEILFKELFHRTKNNMQIISSIISLQMLENIDDKGMRMLSEMKNRIQAISLVHEQLYRANEISKIDLKEYISRLINLLSSSFMSELNNIEFKTELDNISVSIDTAVPCGLIINELVSNSIKYAFPDGRKGIISINLKKQNDQIELMVVDNGVGVPPGTNLLNKDTLGMSLFKNIAEGQLEGKIKIESNQGMSFSVTFKNNNLN